MPRVRTLLGSVLVAAGAGVVAWFAWQYAGTNWVSQRAHRDVVGELREAWGADRPRVTGDHGTAVGVVRIPRFGEDYEVPVLEGTSGDALAAGFGHVDGTAPAGGEGNYVIAGHRVTHGEPLRDMPELEPGDEVLVETRDATYVYRLTTGGDDLEVPFTAAWVLDARPVNPDRGGTSAVDDDHLLTVTTCAELFHTEERLVAFGRLVEVRPAT